MIIFLASFVFKIMHWPGANILLGISLVLFMVLTITIIISVFSSWREYNDELINIYKFALIYLIAILIMFGFNSL